MSARMLVDAVPPWRSARLERAAGELRITFEPRRIVAQVLLAFGLFVFWAQGFFNLWQKLAVATEPARRYWLTGGLIFWAVWGAVVVGGLLGRLLGRELVLVTSRVLTLRREMLGGLGWSRRLDVSRIRNAWYETPAVGWSWPRFPRRPPTPPRLGGFIVLEYGRRRHRVGVGVDWPGMAVTLEALRERIPIASTRAGRDGTIR